MVEITDLLSRKGYICIENFVLNFTLSMDYLEYIPEIKKKKILPQIFQRHGELGLRQAVVTSFSHGKWRADVQPQSCWLFSISACFGCWASILVRQCLYLFLIMGINFVLVYRKHLWIKCQREQANDERMWWAPWNGEEIREHIATLGLLGNSMEI